MAGSGESLTSSIRDGVLQAKEIVKVVKMSDTVTIIPDTNPAFCSPEVPCERNQETPDYIRRCTPRNRIKPLELFSNSDSIEGKYGLRSSMEIVTEVSPVMQNLDKSETVLKLQATAEANNDRHGAEGLSITFEGVDGEPLVCDINIKESSPVNHGQNNEYAAEIPGFRVDTCSTTEREKEKVECCTCKKLVEQYDSMHMEQIEARKALENLRKDYDVKCRECHEAQVSLHELQMELMRKSMHVGSLAFAVEGQVKEKSRWFQSMQNLSKNVEVLKIEHANLSTKALEYKRWLAEMAYATATIQSTLDAHVNIQRDCNDLKQRFIEEARERKDLYNKLIELKGNIRVFCRSRPLNAEEIALGASAAIEFETVKDGELSVKVNGIAKKYKFDAVFNPQEDQGKVFEKTSPFATSVLDGYNVCIFAYGQTGTGKTFTMEGTEVARGVNYRTLEELFRIVEERRGLCQYDITVSVLEVYNEQIRDLLLSGAQPGAVAKRLEVRQVAEGVHHVPGLVEANVSTMNEAWAVLQTGSKARAVGTTNANEHSSRSHCIHCVMVRGENLITGECTRSKLWLIDLAGSERVAKTDAQGERLKEAQSINKSLSALGDVISALATKSQHIPFRNSKLTHLLQDSLGGDSKVLMFVQISPNEDDVGETLCSLNFASRVRGIELGQAKKQVEGGEMLKYKQMVEKAKQDSKIKDCQIKVMEETIQSLEIKNKSKDLTNKNLQEKIKELEAQLLIERKLARQHVDNKIAEQHQQQLQHQERRASFVTQPLSEIKLNDGSEQMSCFKDQGHITQPHTDNKLIQFDKESDIIKRYPFLEDKENEPELSEDKTFSRKATRVSLCPTSRQVPFSPASRRNSLIPPSALKATFPPLSQQQNVRDLPPPVSMTLQGIVKESPSLKGENSQGCRSSRKINSILRRSLQKKVIIRSPLQPNIRRGGSTLASGLDKVRASANGSARKIRKLTANTNYTRPDRDAQQKKLQKEKERGWNYRTPEKNY